MLSVALVEAPSYWGSEDDSGLPTSGRSWLISQWVEVVGVVGLSCELQRR